VRVELYAQDKLDFFRRRLAGELNLHLMGWACQTGEAGEALDILFHSKTSGLGGENIYGLADGEVDRLIDAANASDTLPERLANVRAAVARLAALRPIVPLVVQPEAVAMSRHVQWDPPMNYAFRLESLHPALAAQQGR
jgi:ABC-type oligopeptide transport system substrate-binding subunit